MSPSDSNSPVHSDYDEKVNILTEHVSAASREKPDPTEGNEPPPLIAIMIAGFALIVGAGYLGGTNGGLSNDSFTFVEGYDVPPVPGGGVIEEQKPPGEIWLAEGKKQYSAICAACHQGNGQGQTGVYPPLANSEWVTGGTEQLAMIILNGIQGPITVDGQSYNSLMTPWKDALNDKQMAQVMSYIRMSWGNAEQVAENSGMVTAEMVAHARATHDIPGMKVSHLEGFDKDLPGAKVDPITMEPIGGGAAEGGATDEEPAGEE